MLAEGRQEGIDAARTSNWKWSADYLIGKQLTGTRLGILGMGRIGKKIAKIAKSLGMTIHYHNRSKLSIDQEEGASYHKDLKSLIICFGCFICLLPSIERDS